MYRYSLTLLALLTLLVAVAPARADEDDAEKRVRNLVKADLPGAAEDAPETSESDAFRMRASGRLEFHARDLDVADALAQLRRLLRTNIVVSPDVKARFTGDLYDVTLTEVLDAICRSAKLRHRRQGAILYVEPEGRSTRIFRLSYARAEDLIPLLAPLVSTEGKVVATLASQTGIGSDQEAAGGDSYAGAEVVVATDYAPNMDDIASAIAALDQRPRQVFIEATICSADVEHGRELGIEFNSLTGINFNEMGATSGGTDGVTLGNVPSDGFDDGLGAAETNFLDGLSKTGLNVGIIGDTAAAFVRALRLITNVNVLANPRVMAVNKQRGEVIVGRRDGYLTTTVTQTESIQDVEFLETGTRLIFRPFIGEDGWIRMEIHPEDSEGGVNADGLPFKQTAEVTTNLLVKSGQTIVIGGLLRERHGSTRRGIPGVGNLPGGVPFLGSDKRGVKREEVIIILTPRIVETEECKPDGCGKTAKRKMSLGSKRLADSYARVADRAVAEGRFDRARSFLARVEKIDPTHAVLTRMAPLLRRAPATGPTATTEVASRIRAHAAAGASKPTPPAMTGSNAPAAPAPPSAATPSAATLAPAPLSPATQGGGQIGTGPASSADLGAPPGGGPTPTTARATSPNAVTPNTATPNTATPNTATPNTATPNTATPNTAALLRERMLRRAKTIPSTRGDR